MSRRGKTNDDELTLLRQQVEALTRRLAELESRPGGARGPSSPEAAGSSASPAAAATEEIPWMVIAAAVASVVTGPHRIVSLQLPGLPPFNLWSIEGRRAVFFSHRVR